MVIQRYFFQANGHFIICEIVGKKRAIFEREKNERDKKRPRKAEKRFVQKDGHFIFCKIVGGEMGESLKKKKTAGLSIFNSKAEQTEKRPRRRKKTKERPKDGHFISGGKWAIFWRGKRPMGLYLKVRPGKPKKDQEGQKKATEGQKRPRKCIFS